MLSCGVYPESSQSGWQDHSFGDSGTHVVFHKYMGRAPLSVGQRLLEYKGDGLFGAIISSFFLQQTATFLLLRCQQQDASKRGCMIRGFEPVTLQGNTFLWLVQSSRSGLGLQQKLRLSRLSIIWESNLLAVSASQLRRIGELFRMPYTDLKLERTKRIWACRTSCLCVNLMDRPVQTLIHTNCSRRQHPNVILPSRQPRRPWSTG
jgi:hypothetical protein